MNAQQIWRELCIVAVEVRVAGATFCGLCCWASGRHTDEEPKFGHCGCVVVHVQV